MLFDHGVGVILEERYGWVFWRRFVVDWETPEQDIVISGTFMSRVEKSWGLRGGPRSRLPRKMGPRAVEANILHLVSSRLHKIWVALH